MNVSAEMQVTLLVEIPGASVMTKGELFRNAQVILSDFMEKNCLGFGFNSTAVVRTTVTVKKDGKKRTDTVVIRVRDLWAPPAREVRS